tara:strand:+ start:982 stop:1173 length:192 start_codon:yes stop_codon:yes gene_type:complete
VLAGKGKRDELVPVSKWERQSRLPGSGGLLPAELFQLLLFEVLAELPDHSDIRIGFGVNEGVV